MAVAPASNAASVLAWDRTQNLPKPPSKTNPTLAIAGAAAIALLVGSGLWRYSHAPKTAPTVNIVCAGQNVPSGVKLGYFSLHYLTIPKSAVTSDMVTSYESVTDRMTRSFIGIGEPIKNSSLLPKNCGLSSNLENDERAISLDLNSDAAVDYSIRPDDLVDILAVTTSKDGKKYTKTIGQAVRVLMSTPKDQLSAKNMSNAAAKGITLAVAPDLAETITEASEIGKLRLVLRSRLSRTKQSLDGIGPAALLPPIAEEKPPTLPLPPLPLEAIPQQTVPVAMPNKEDQPIKPLEWLVEVITGSHKESYGVPEN
jgi:Flp pilus assembly protein CpaB